MILGVCGKKNSGKNITGVAIQALMLGNDISKTEYLVKNSIDVGWTDLSESEWRIKSFAHKVKEVASVITGYSIKSFDDREFKDSYDYYWGMTMREMLQRIGTDCMRDNLDRDVWVKALMSEYISASSFDFQRGNMPKWIIVDMRFENEADAIRRHSGYVLKLLRNIDSNDNHPSEKSVEDIEPDYTIDNRNLSIKNNIIEIKKFLSNIHLL